MLSLSNVGGQNLGDKIDGDGGGDIINMWRQFAQIA